MPKKIDLTNQQFGDWIVIREATKEEKEQRPGAYWLCKCSCGKEKIVNGQTLRKGESKSCGCKSIELIKKGNQKKATDMTNQKYGLLTVLERDFQYEETFIKKRSQTYWKCKCECGNITTVGRNDLITGRTKSCGCLRKKIATQHMSDISSNNFIDETNNKYGKLTVLYKINKNNSNRSGIVWHCRCECGNEKDVYGIDLRNGTVSSCGCMGKSKGEWKIQQILEKNKISYGQEYTQIIDNKKLRFDFIIYYNNQNKFYFIEFDGKQHSFPSEFFGGEEYLKYIQ